MTRTLRATALPSLLALTGALLALCAPAGAAEAVSPLPESDYGVRPLCAPPAPWTAGCLALELVPRTAAARARTHPLGITSTAPIGALPAAEGAYGLRPQDLHSVYQLSENAPSSQTIALVEAYNDPNAEADLQTYDQEFGLPACTHENGCLTQVNEAGEHTNLPFPRSDGELSTEESRCKTGASAEIRKAACEAVTEAKGWIGEMSLDIEVAHAVCQNCHIALVEAGSPHEAKLETAEETAARPVGENGVGATEISNSWGFAECTEPLAGERLCVEGDGAFNHPGIVIAAAAGDDGYLGWYHETGLKGFAEFPAASPHVVSVGGTRLEVEKVGEALTWGRETVWNGDGAGGGGCSTAFAAEPWQQSVSDWARVGCEGKRAVADVSADADPYTGVAVYDSLGGCELEEGVPIPWCTIGGTSLSSPLIASAFALAGGSGAAPYPAKTLYEREADSPASLHDITVGSNGECPAPFNSEGLSGCQPFEEAARSCRSDLICLAESGYDGPTGVGTPDGLGAFQPPSGESSAIPATASGSPGPSAAGRPPVTVSLPVLPPPAAVKLTRLTLTTNALVALNSSRPRISQVGFVFSISAVAHVRVALAKRVRVHGHARWQTLPSSITFAAIRGRNSRRLSGQRILSAGLYRLTLTPAGGPARSLTFQIG